MLIADAENRLREATGRYNTADAANRKTSSELTAARNQLNDAQKAFDQCVASLRSSAPRGTDWTQSRVSGDTADD